MNSANPGAGDAGTSPTLASEVLESPLQTVLPFTQTQPDARGILASCVDQQDAVVGFYKRSKRAFAEASLGSFVAGVYATARAIQADGLRTGDVAVVAIGSNDDGLRAFLAALALGATPLMLAVRPAFDDPSTAAGRLDHVLATLPPSATVIISSGAPPPTATRPYRLVELPASPDAFASSVIELPPAQPHETAYLQLSSGSTGEPKPIAVSHGALVAQMESLTERCRLQPDDIFNIWLPLYHDLALVAFAFLPMGMRTSLSFMTPFDFLGDPSSWIRALSQTGATTTAAPNFGLRHATARVKDRRLDGVDLSHVRRVCCGAEPISADTLRSFRSRFEPYGMRDDVLVPTYGMAETTLMLTMPARGRPVMTMAVPRASLLELGQPAGVRRGSLDDPPTLDDEHVEVVGVGPQGLGTEIWICDERGNRIDDDLRCGEVVTRSTSLASGYLLVDGSLDEFAMGGYHTGDIGFLDRGELFIVDRLKNTIIRNGRNISAAAIEHVVADIAGLPSDATMVIDSDLAEGQGRLTALIELERNGDPSELITAIETHAERFHPPLDEVIVVRPGGLPRTTSGKKRHRRARQLLATADLAIAAQRSLTLPFDQQPTPGTIDLTELETSASAIETIQRLARRRSPNIVVESDSSLAVDLGFDSLQMYELAMMLEDSLDIELHDEDLRGPLTVGDLIGTCTERRRAPVTATGSGITASIDAAAVPTSQILQLVQAQKSRQLQIEGRWVSDFASCNYLGLDLHPDVIDSIEPAIREWGVHPSWTRVVASPAPYRTLEERLAELVHAPDTVVFPTLTLLHMGVLPELATPDGTIFVDQSAHASLHQATEFARGRGTKVVPFDHTDLAALDSHLRRSHIAPRLIVVDGVYSMSGGPAPLHDLEALATEHDATLYVDDAHGFGILGEHPTPAAPYGRRGNGVVRHLGLGYDRIVYTAGLSKAYSSMGAFITARTPADRRRFETAGTMVFSGPVPTASLASALAGLRVNDAEGEAIRTQLRSLTERLISGVSELGLPGDNGHGLPIVNVTIGSVAAAKEAAELLWEHALLITPSLFPAVPLDRSGLRFTVTAANTIDEVDQALAALALVRERMTAGVLR